MDPTVTVPELESDIEVASEGSRRRGGLVRALVAGAIAVGLIAMMIGIVPIFQQEDAPEVPLAALDLPTAEVVDTNFGGQVPSWIDCGNGFECAEVQAPLDWANTDGDAITLRLVKHPAENSDPLGTLFVNPGGPGASGADYVRGSLDSAVSKDLQRDYDVIGWDPRGVGASSPVTCLTDAEMDDYLYGADDAEDIRGVERGSDEWVELVTEEVRGFAAACLEHTGPLLGFVDTESTAHDLDMLREIVGDQKLNYLGYSYGTYIGARYADAFPDRVGRMVLDGAVNPSATLEDVVREQTLGFEAALRTFVTTCLAERDCPLLGGAGGSGSAGGTDAGVDAAMAHIEGLLDRVDADPLTGTDGRILDSGTLLTAIVTPLYSKQNWRYLKQLFASVEEGNADIGLALADSYYGRYDGKYIDNSTQAFAAINCLDYPQETDLERMREEAAELAQLAPTIGKHQGYGGLSCADWPYPGVEERAPVTAAGAAPIIVIGTTGDPATPYQSAVSLAEQLESGVLLRHEGEGHTAYGKNACVNRVVDTYFLDGTPPGAGTTC